MKRVKHSCSVVLSSLPLCYRAIKNKWEEILVLHDKGTVILLKNLKICIKFNVLKYLALLIVDISELMSNKLKTELNVCKKEACRIQACLNGKLSELMTI